MKYMHPAKVLTQATSSATAAATVLWETFGQRRPADRCLSSLLRRNRHFGSRHFGNRRHFDRSWLRRLLGQSVQTTSHLYWQHVAL